jgi:hypothetical protein
MLTVATRALLMSFIAALVAASAQADEQRCGQLGEACVCNEPLNTNTHGGGTNWSSGNFNPSDSSAAKSCGHNGIDGVTNGSMVPVGSVPFSLPAGNRLQYVFRHQGFTNGKIEKDCTNQELGKTYCIRGYRRWGNNPLGGSLQGQNQTKILDLGGYIPSSSKYSTLQMSWGGDANGRQLNARFDQGPWNCDMCTDFLPIPLDLASECRNNLCYFEECIDIQPNGTASMRYRARSLGSGASHTKRIPTSGYSSQAASGTVVYSTSDATCFKGMGLWGENFSNGGSPDSWNSHMLFASTPLNEGFWIGPACEVEGGCNGNPPPPPTVTPPVQPVLLP